MASDITHNPWVFDSSTFAGEYSTGVVFNDPWVNTSGNLNIQNGVPQLHQGFVIRPYRAMWVCVSATAGNRVVIQSADGTATYWESVATGADFEDLGEIPFDDRALWHGLKIPTFEAGKLYLYYR